MKEHTSKVLNAPCMKFQIEWHRIHQLGSLANTAQSGRAQNALQWEWGNFPFANWNGICWGLLLQLVQLIKIHFLPHLESFIWERKFEKKFFKKSHIQTPNGVLFIFKLPFPNGSYRNGVCRALWAMIWKVEIRLKCIAYAMPAIIDRMKAWNYLLMNP